MRIPVVLAVAVLSGCASMGSQPDPVQLKLDSLDAENQELRSELAETQRRLSGLGAVGLGSSVANLEEQVRMLRGQVEELQYKLDRQNERQRALYVDLDSRLQGLEGGSSGSSSSARVQQDNNADQKAYLAAFQSLKSGSYDQAIGAFEDFLGKYPDSPYAPNAQYWIGEAFYVDREFDKAWGAFAKVLSRYPGSAKASDALLKQGLLRVEQGNNDEGRGLLRKVVSDYPNSTAANLARARLQQMGGE